MSHLIVDGQAVYLGDTPETYELARRLNSYQQLGAKISLDDRNYGLRIDGELVSLDRILGKD